MHEVIRLIPLPGAQALLVPKLIAAGRLAARFSRGGGPPTKDLDLKLAPRRFRHAGDEADPLAGLDGAKFAYTAMMRWIGLATACRLPATAIPVGQTPEGLPVGAQIIGPHGADARTIGVAQAIDERLGGFVGPPES